MSNRLVRALVLIAFGVLFVQSGTVTALDAPKSQATSTLAAKEFFKPELHLSSTNVPLEQAFDSLSNKDAWSRFAATYGQPQVYLDPRSGTATGVITRVPMIPGRGDGNKVGLREVGAALGHKVDEIDRKTVADLVRGFATRNAGAIGIDSTQLGKARAEQVTENLWHVVIPQVVNGVPVRYGHMVAVINSGNLVLLGTETWGNVNLDTRPKILDDQAMSLGFAYVGGRLGTDVIPEKPNLEILPVAPQEMQVGEGFGGPIGLGYRHRLVWSFMFERKGEDGRWEVIVDAHSGEVVSFEDTNHYATKEITGGVYPLTSTEICPSNDRCGQMFPGYPMPFADTGLASPNNFTNSAGLFNYTSGNVTTHLSGKYVKISDNCGAVNEVGVGTVLLGGVNGQHDCTTAGASAGDTPASRSAFYEVNKLMEMGRGWLPANAWLQQQMQTNVNIQNTCNAFYSTLDGTINFYRSGGGCRNTGEIAAVFDHEWGHALDDNDSGGSLSTSSEGYADIAAIYRLQASCVGYGFFQTVDDGCGMTSDGTGFNANEAQTGPAHCDNNCSGVRDADWAAHANNTPDTPQNFSCGSCVSGSGPCGRQVHCDAAPTRQSAWDFVNRDLMAPPFNMTRNDAYIVGNKLFYQGSGVVGSWHSCSCPNTSDGCGATNGYMAWLSADDDNGNLADGTPHMTALNAAFARHNMACATPAPTNGGCAGGPTTAPNLNVAVGSNSLSLSWNAVPGASSYRVLRSEGYAGCDFGKAVIANVNGTNYTDPDVANGRTYSYVVQAVGGSGACFSPGSACVQGTPQPCAGSISLSQYLYNCGGAPLNITLVDGDLTGTVTQTVSVSSATEPTPETVTLTETPANSGVFTGTFGTTPAPAAPLDGAISITNGDTISVNYLDVDYCGTPNVSVTQTAAVDCAGPIITNVQVSNITGNSVDVTFDTNEPTDAVVLYGNVPPPNTVKMNATLTTTHTVHLSGLDGCTAYVASVQATDPAGNTASDDNAGAYYGFITLVNVTPTFAYSGPPLPILDNTTITASFTVADTRVIQGVKAKIVNLTHTYDGDLAIFLIGPNGTRVELTTRNGGTGENFVNTVFDDAAATSIIDGTPPYTGSYRPEGSLATLNGIPANGTWSLEVADLAGSDEGTLTAWEIELQFPAEQCPTVGRVTLDKTSYQCTETAQIHVVDFSILNAGTVPVTVSSATENAGETVVLNETPANSGSFIGNIPLTISAASTNDGYLSITDGDTMTVTYIDADDGYGGTNIPRTDTAIIDCSGPSIANVQAVNVTGRSADITWTTGELATSLAYFGVDPTPTDSLSSATLVASHSLHIEGLTPCTTYVFYVSSTDATNNSTTDDNSGAYFSFTTLTDNQPVFSYAGGPASIPDNSILGVSVPITVADVKEILDVDVSVSISHPNVGDLEVLLIAPGGVQVSLALRRGGTGDNFGNTLFDDAAATSIANGTAPFAGVFKPETPLSALNGRLTNGTWSLRVRDRAAGNTGTVTAWSLHLTYSLLACDAPYVQEASHSIADSCLGGPANSVVDPGENLSIPYELVNTGNAPVTEVAASISTTTPGVTFSDGMANYGALAIGQRAFGDAPFQALLDGSVPCGTLITFNVNATGNEGTWGDSFDVRVGTPVFAQSTLPSTDTPKPLPDVRTAQLSTIAVADPGVVGDVNVEINITHTYDGDLDIFLIGPNGTRVELTTDNGNSQQNFVHTVFDDAAATSITQGAGPFTGSFRPEGLLSTLNGIPAAGNWTLEITDDANGDSGVLNSWSLIVTTPNGYSCTSCGLVAPGEVSQLKFTAKDTVEWAALSGATEYYLYRGSSAALPNLLNGSLDSCERGTTSGTSLSGISEVIGNDFMWYLVRGHNAAGYGSAGAASAGPRVQDSSGVCP